MSNTKRYPTRMHEVRETAEGGRGMTRQEAAIIIKAIGKHAIETHLTDPGDILDATVMAVQALVPKPDEVTGLVPCGCGGKAEYTDNATAVCMWCGISTLENFNDADAAKVWNRAMGGDYTVKGIKPPETVPVIPERVDVAPGFDQERDQRSGGAPVPGPIPGGAG